MLRETLTLQISIARYSTFCYFQFQSCLEATRNDLLAGNKWWYQYYLYFELYNQCYKYRMYDVKESNNALHSYHVTGCLMIWRLKQSVEIYCSCTQLLFSIKKHMTWHASVTCVFVTGIGVFSKSIISYV